MHAWIVERLTPEGEVRFADVPKPMPQAGQCVIRVEAAGMNFLDTLMIRGQYQVKPPLPFTPGIEVAGAVIAAGSDSPYEIGERLCAVIDHGGYAEFALVGSGQANVLPSDVPFRDAVALPIIYPTAHMALRDRAGLRAGETVLVHAGAGGTGSAAIQLAKHWGARVIATAGGTDKVEICRELGADLAIDYAVAPLVEAIRDATDGRGVDVVVDPVGGQTTLDSLRCLAWKGRLVIVGFAGGKIAELPANRLLLKSASAMGVYFGECRTREPELAAAVFTELVGLYRTGAIRPLIRDTFRLAEADKALAAMAARRTVGKVVILP